MPSQQNVLSDIATTLAELLMGSDKVCDYFKCHVVPLFDMSEQGSLSTVPAFDLFEAMRLNG
jgi:hypothetical protein